MRINYLLEDTALFGGVKVVLHHANLLDRRGHSVRVISRGPRPEWYALDGDFRRVGGFSIESIPEADVNVATFWTTIRAAAKMPTGQAVHFCQGFEAGLDHNRDQHQEILDAYAIPVPAFVVSPHLAELLRDRFGRPARLVQPAVEHWWRPRRRWGPRKAPRILVPSPFENYVKGVPTAIEAVRHLREEGLRARLVRVSQWPLTDEERHLVEPDEFHINLVPAEVARLVSGCDLVMAPSSAQEGFGLWVLEAMASGVPVVASRIPAHEGFAAGAAELVEPGDVEAFASAARRILGSRRSWRKLRRAGLRRAGLFDETSTATRLESAMHWAASGHWREDV